MPYTKKQIYSVIPAETVDSNNFAGRDRWVERVATVMQQAGWIKRLASAFATITTTAGPAVSAIVFMNCGTGNAGNWGVFNPNNFTSFFIIDEYDPDPPTKMACIKAGAVSGGYTSLGYVAVGLSGDAIHNAIINIAIPILYPGASFDSSVGVRQTIMKLNSPLNVATGLTFGTNTLTSGDTWKGGGYVLRAQPSTILTNKGIFGNDNYLEIYMTGTRDQVATVNWGAFGLCIAACKEFGTFPSLSPQAPATGLYVNSLIGDGTSGKRYRTNFNNPKLAFNTTLFASKHQVLVNSEGVAAGDRFYFLGSALPLFDVRALETSDVILQELTIFSSESGSGASGFFNSGYLSGWERKVINFGPSYNNVRYDLSGGTNLQPGVAQLGYLTSGRAIGNILRGIPWAGGEKEYAAACEPWLGWSMTGRGASDVAVCPTHLWDALILAEATPTSNNPAFGSAADLPKFFQGGAWWKRYTKKPLGDTWKAMTLCLKIDDEMTF